VYGRGKEVKHQKKHDKGPGRRKKVKKKDWKKVTVKKKKITEGKRERTDAGKKVL